MQIKRLACAALCCLLVSRTRAAQAETATAAATMAARRAPIRQGETMDERVNTGVVSLVQKQAQASP